jgi:hypothetical protein
MSIFKDSRFGDPNAISDDLLHHCFVDTEAFRRVFSPGSYFLIGRKGSGKTAIALMIDRWRREPLPEQRTQEWSLPMRNTVKSHVHDVVRILPIEIGAPDLSPVRAHYSKIRSFPEQSFMTNAWECYILGRAMRHMAKSWPNQLIAGDRAVVWDYLKSFSLTDSDTVERFVDFALRALKSFKKLIGKGSSSVEEFANNLRAQWPAFNRAREAFFRICAALPGDYLVFVDDVDHIAPMKSVGNEAAKAFYNGLFFATVTLNEEARTLTPKPARFRIVSLFTSAARYGLLDMYHYDKYRSSVIELNWDDSGLQSMIARRLSQQARKPTTGTDPNTVWCHYIENSPIVSPSEDNRNTSTWNAFLEYSFRNPRDIIVFLSMLGQRDGPNKEQISDVDFAIALRQFYVDRIQQVKDEYRFVLDVNAVLDVMRAAVKSGRLERLFDYDTLGSVLRGGNLGVKTQEDVFNRAKELYDMGFFGVGLFKPDDSVLPTRPKHEVSFLVPYLANELKSSHFLLMHPAFANALGMRRFTRVELYDRANRVLFLRG